MESLDEIALRYGTDKASNGHGFTAVYETLFAPVRHEPLRLLEIGVWQGASLRTWLEYFPQATIVGVDIGDNAHGLDPERATLLVGNQADSIFMQKVANLGPFDIVIDDGGHRPEQQLTSLHTVWPTVNPSGVYAVEDAHTSYLEAYAGGWRRPGTLIEVVKDAVDDVNRDWHGNLPLLPDLAALHVYPELVVLVKDQRLSPATSKSK
jgi:hypothetical protein